MANKCYEGIAVTDGNSPFGPYHVYYFNADYNPAEPGYPSLLNDFAKISVTRDAFMMFYDEFPLSGSLPGMGGGFFNGAQEYAFRKSALEQGLPVKKRTAEPNPAVTVARENMGHIPTQKAALHRDQDPPPGRHHLLGGGDPRTAGRRPVRQQPRRHRVHGGLARLLRVPPAGDLR